MNKNEYPNISDQKLKSFHYFPTFHKMFEQSSSWMDILMSIMDGNEVQTGEQLKQIQEIIFMLFDRYLLSNNRKASFEIYI